MKSPKKTNSSNASETWSIGIFEGTSPFTLKPMAGARNPVLAAIDVSDRRASFVADPFLVRDGERWHLFFEVLNAETGLGEIGWAVSDDLRHWAYRHIVLQEKFHLSYPYVFRHGADYYMIPETLDAGAIRLYRADPFPLRWTHVRDLVPGVFADPSPIFFKNHWWLFACSTPWENHTLNLFEASALEGPWREHPSSPIVRNQVNRARPAGRILEWNERLHRFAQDCHPNYGTKVHAFAITELTPTRYAEKPVRDESIVGPGALGWNSDGMHHVDAFPLGKRHWIAAVDGWTLDAAAVKRKGKSIINSASPEKLHYWRSSWPLREDLCPCDIHFVDYLRARNVGAKSIFHFGTGEHHLVGKENARFETPNDILGITASRKEHTKYLNFIIHNPAAANAYKVLFADIYTLSPGLLPEFDFITLFHLGEYYHKTRSAYARLDDTSLAEMLVEKLRPGGKLLFYTGSDGFPKTREIINRLIRQRKIARAETFQSLLIYSKR
jgi:hypothetical protein